MKFEVYKDKTGEFRWRLRHANGNILATASESYKARTSVLRCIENVQNSASAPIEELK